MYFVTLTFVAVISTFYLANGMECKSDCPNNENAEAVCGFDEKRTTYKMFPSKCAMETFVKCYETAYLQTPVEYCIKQHSKSLKTRRYIDESCPVFCANYWRPVCAARENKSYVYKSFMNRCYLDMINCRGDDDEDTYVEVPLELCPRHAMKNYFKERVIISGGVDYNNHIYD